MAEAFGVAASALAVAELALKIISQCVRYSRAVKHAKEDIERVSKEVSSWENVMQELRALLENPQGTRLQTSQKLRDGLEGGQAQLQRLHGKLHPPEKHKTLTRLHLRSLKWPLDSEEAEEILQELARCMGLVTLALQIDQTKTMFEFDQKWVLSRLPLAEGATFDSYAEQDNPTCLPETRVELLLDISKWIEDSEKTVFWLNGMAGTGKSTISRTLARTFLERGQLGASFFFKRGEGDRGGAFKLFTTIASQLVQQEPDLAPHVKAAIDADHGIVKKQLDDQFEKLILEPLSKIPSIDRILVIDALDECDRAQDIKRIIQLFSRVNASKPPRLRVFLTSRPELPIRLGFHNVKGTYESLILHKIEHTIIKRDLSVYFTHELEKIRVTYNSDSERQLPPTWPKPSEIETLVTMAVPLFIFAATVCRFLEDFRNDSPDTKLRKILKYETKSHESKLSATYLPVLEQLVSDLSSEDRATALERFRRLIGSIVLLASPLSTSALAHLLNTTTDEIYNQFVSLHSVLSIPPSSSAPVRLLHLSFRDFLVDPSNRESVFWVNEKEGHKQLAFHCIRIMSKTLRTDICEVIWPGTSQASIDPKVINDRLAPEVQYACQYWVSHLQQAGYHLLDDDPVVPVRNFLQQHFLHWLEALSLIGRARESLQNIRILQSLCEPVGCSQLSQFIDDALRFVLTNVSTIQETPLQVYCSALVFAPDKSIVRCTFQSNIPDWISLRPKVNTYWDTCLQTLEGHIDSVESVAFSPDGTAVASGSSDTTIRIWSADTGESSQVFKGHIGGVRSVAFSSSDGRTVVSGSYDGTVRLWSINTGENLQTLVGHSRAVKSVAFSPDGTVIASGSYDNTIRIWSADTGENLHIFKGHTNSVLSVAFSPDGKTLVSGSEDGTVRLWSAGKGESLGILHGHTEAVQSVAFSPDGKLVASGSEDSTVRLWSSKSGQNLQVLEGHSFTVTSVAFSPNSKIVVSGSRDETIRLWSAETGKHLQSLSDHTDVIVSVAFSPDGKTVVSGSYDKKIRLWSIDMADLHPLHNHISQATPLTFITLSSDGKIVASGSEQDTAIRLWSADTGEHLQTLKGHTSFALSAVFSPNSKIIASWSWGRTIWLWSTDTGENLRTLNCHTSSVTSVVFSPNGKLVASGSGDTTARLWSVNAGENLQTFGGHTKPSVTRYIDLITFSPDSKVMASGSWDGTVRLWSTDTGDSLQIFKGHTAAILSVAFSSDSRFVASGSSDKTAQLWSASTGSILRSISFDSIPQSLWFTPDDRSLGTEFGAISLGDLCQPASIGSPGEGSLTSSSIHAPMASFTGYGFSVDHTWITLNGRNLLWLPTDCRPQLEFNKLVVRGCSVLFVTKAGRVIAMRFSEDGP